MILQEWIHRLEEGRWARVVKFTALVLGFVVLALYYDLHRYQGFATQEAMESAQLARNISEGKGFVTESISPASLSLLHHHLKQNTFRDPIPDLSTPPAYPLIIAGLMKILPFNFAATDKAQYQPELWIAFFNQALFFLAACLLFQVARRLFDPTVAWFSAVLFVATDLFWRFSLSGLPTLWLIVLFLGLVWGLLVIEEQERPPVNTGPLQPAAPGGNPNRSLIWAVVIGLLLGLGGLARYSFAWLIIPVAVFLWLVAPRQRARLILAATIPFLLLLTPWLARNFSLSGNLFGTSGYAMVQNTWAFSDDTLERSSDLQMGLKRIQPEFFLDKAIANTSDIVQNELPKFGGNWLAAFFLAGLFLPFRNPALSRLRLFLLGSLALFILVEALGRTHLSADAVEINSENLLVLLAPLVLVYGAGMMLTLVDQTGTSTPATKNILLTVLGALLCAPLLLGLMGPPPYPLTVPYFPG